MKNQIRESIKKEIKLEEKINEDDVFSSEESKGSFNSSTDPDDNKVLYGPAIKKLNI